MPYGVTRRRRPGQLCRTVLTMPNKKPVVHRDTKNYPQNVTVWTSEGRVHVRLEEGHFGKYRKVLDLEPIDAIRLATRLLEAAE